MSSVKMELGLRLMVLLPAGKDVYAQADRIEVTAREAVLELIKESGFTGGFVSSNKTMQVDGMEIHDERPTGDLKAEWERLQMSGGMAPPREKHPHAVMAMLDTESKANATLCGRPPLAGDIILYHDALPKEIRVPRCPTCVNDQRYRNWAASLDICWACGSNSFTDLTTLVVGKTYKTCTNCGMSNPRNVDEIQA